MMTLKERGSKVGIDTVFVAADNATFDAIVFYPSTNAASAVTHIKFSYSLAGLDLISYQCRSQNPERCG